MLLGITHQLAGVPVKVSPHRSLNISRGVIRSRDIAGCSVEEIVEELQPQGVTAAVIIHVRDGDSRRRTNTVVLTFASPHPPKHITDGYLRVPVEPYIPNPLRCFKCQKIRPQLQSLQERCYMCEMWGSWPRRSELQQPSKMCQLQR